MYSFQPQPLNGIRHPDAWLFRWLHVVVPKLTEINQSILEGAAICACAFAVIIRKPIGINVDITSVATTDRQIRAVKVVTPRGSLKVCIGARELVTVHLTDSSVTV